MTCWIERPGPELRDSAQGGPPRTREAGYTYVSVLMILAVMAIAAQTAILPPESVRIRAAEAELLFRGQAYMRAIESYRAAGGANGLLPRDLNDLVEDPRADGLRHIRRLYPDPMSSEGWQLLRGADGGIAGVASTGTGIPRRTAFFPEGLDRFAEAETYADWEFTLEP